MEIIQSLIEIQRCITQHKKEGKTIGFVPTMGYFHEGHLSLIKLARMKADVVVVSIFVNPTQFGPTEDYNTYPRDLSHDCRLAEQLDVDILFVPEVKDMYPDGYCTYVDVEGLSDKLCGAFRPGHFRGVATVVTKLFNLIQPQFAVFGQKDGQQAILIKRMVKDLNFGIEIIVAPTVREPDGLAMSSRNSYLSAEERRDATIIFQSLKLAENMIHQGERQTDKIVNAMKDLISSKQNANIEYIFIVRTDNLEPIDKLQRGEILIALAVRIGRTRLIDNLLMNIS